MTPNKLPEKYRKKWVAKVKGATFFGVSVETLSKEDLLAMAMNGWTAEQEARDDHRQTISFMSTRNKVRGRGR